MLKDLGIGFLYIGRFISDLRGHSGLKFALKQVSAVGENYNSIHYHLLPNLERFIVEEEYSPVYHVKYVPSYHIMRSLCDGYPWVEDNLGIKMQLRNVPVLTAMPGITFKPLYEGYTVQVAFSDGDSSRVTTTSNIKKDIASFTDDWIDATKKVLEEENIQSPDFIDLLAALPRR